MIYSLVKNSKFLMSLALLTTCWIISGCEWSKKNRAETERHFRKCKSDYLQAVASVKSGGKPAGAVANAIYYTKSAPTIIEFSPIDFYYAIVYVDHRADLDRSLAMLDEGVLLEDLGGGFYLVRRGFM